MVEIEMGAGRGHEFWFGRINLLTYISKGEVRVRSPVQKFISLLPVIRPAYVLYPYHLEKNEFDHLNIL